MRRTLSAGAGVIGLALIAGCAPKETDTAAAPPSGMAAQEPAPVAQPAAAPAADEVVLTNTVCPVMGGKADPAVFVEHEGRKVYFCCAGCPETFAKDPAKYLAALDQSSTEPKPTAAGDDPHAGHGHAAGDGS